MAAELRRCHPAWPCIFTFQEVLAHVDKCSVGTPIQHCGLCLPSSNTSALHPCLPPISIVPPQPITTKQCALVLSDVLKRMQPLCQHLHLRGIPQRPRDIAWQQAVPPRMPNPVHGTLRDTVQVRPLCHHPNRHAPAMQSQCDSLEATERATICGRSVILPPQHGYPTPAASAPVSQPPCKAGRFPFQHH